MRSNSRSTNIRNVLRLCFYFEKLKKPMMSPRCKSILTTFLSSSFQSRNKSRKWSHTNHKYHFERQFCTYFPSPVIYSVSFNRTCSISRWFFVCLCEKCFTLFATETKTEHAQCVCFSVYAASQQDAQIESYESFWFSRFFFFLVLIFTETHRPISDASERVWFSVQMVMRI